MRLARFDDNRLGVLEGDVVKDVSVVLDQLSRRQWPEPLGDALIEALPTLRPVIKEALVGAAAIPLASVRLLSPVARPTKIVAAPVNYKLHLEEARASVEINYGMPVKTIDQLGLFLKSSTSLVGPSEGVTRYMPDRRIDHEIELAVIIGKTARHVSQDTALDYVAGYCIGLDMSVRGTEDRSWRKSLDSFTVLGPALVTADEVHDPDSLAFRLSVNGEKRQESNTKLLVFDVRKLIAYASESYTLFPGDVILTGTPEGVGEVTAGDTMHCWIESLGEMDVSVHSTHTTA